MGTEPQEPAQDTPGRSFDMALFLIVPLQPELGAARGLPTAGGDAHRRPLWVTGAGGTGTQQGGEGGRGRGKPLAWEAAGRGARGRRRAGPLGVSDAETPSPHPARLILLAIRFPGSLRSAALEAPLPPPRPPGAWVRGRAQTSPWPTGATLRQTLSLDPQPGRLPGRSPRSQMRNQARQPGEQRPGRGPSGPRAQAERGDSPEDRVGGQRREDGRGAGSRVPGPPGAGLRARGGDRSPHGWRGGGFTHEGGEHLNRWRDAEQRAGWPEPGARSPRSAPRAECHRGCRGACPVVAGLVALRVVAGSRRVPESEA